MGSLDDKGDDDCLAGEDGLEYGESSAGDSYWSGDELAGSGGGFGESELAVICIVEKYIILYFENRMHSPIYYKT